MRRNSNCKCSGICSETNFFTLTHKGQTTVHIKETATVETVQAALQQLTTLRDAVVTFSGLKHASQDKEMTSEYDSIWILERSLSSRTLKSEALR